MWDRNSGGSSWIEGIDEYKIQREVALEYFNERRPKRKGGEGGEEKEDGTEIPITQSKREKRALCFSCLCGPYWVFAGVAGQGFGGPLFYRRIPFDLGDHECDEPCSFTTGGAPKRAGREDKRRSSCPQHDHACGC